MKKKYSIVVSLALFALHSFAQSDGYWDKERATTKEIIVSARDRIVVKTDDFPLGTTEVIYRITILDENQQLATSLVSVLKSIPDPTGISQGSAGAVFILSKISGSDKFKYAIFSSSESALEYKETGKTIHACMIQDEAVSKDAKRITVEQSNCLKDYTKAMWFGFESTNWILDQKIILEVVPWVNSSSSRGWSIANRKTIIEQCKTSSLAQKLSNSDDLCVCVLEKIQAKYKFPDFQKLLAAERSKTFKDAGFNCYKETSVSDKVYDDLRNEALFLSQNGKKGEAIRKLLVIVTDGKANALDHNAIGSHYLITKQYAKAIKYLKEGELLDDSELSIKLNLAHAYLLDDNYKEAKVIYKKYQNQNVTDTLSWIQKVKLDFIAFKKVGIQNNDFERVLNLFKK